MQFLYISLITVLRNFQKDKKITLQSKETTLKENKTIFFLFTHISSDRMSPRTSLFDLIIIVQVHVNILVRIIHLAKTHITEHCKNVNMLQNISMTNTKGIVMYQPRRRGCLERSKHYFLMILTIVCYTQILQVLDPGSLTQNSTFCQTQLSRNLNLSPADRNIQFPKQCSLFKILDNGHSSRAI